MKQNKLHKKLIHLLARGICFDKNYTILNDESQVVVAHADRIC